MIVIIDRPGQLCNRLWAYTPLIAFCLEHKINLKVIYFNKYFEHFENVNRNKYVKIGLAKNFLSYRIFRRTLLCLKKSGIIKFLTFLSIIDYPINNFKTFKRLMLNQESMVLLNSWNQPYDIDLIKKHKNQIKKIFSPKLKTKNNVNKIFENHCHKSDTIVGVHIRRQDYKEFYSGKYYYNDDIYSKYMNSLKNKIQYESNRKVKFFLCSDEPINLSSFSAFNYFFLEDSSPINDLYGLSKCNYIIGPPSTFSMWASFYGNVPLNFIESSDKNINLADFSNIIAMNRFKNGRIYRAPDF